MDLWKHLSGLNPAALWALALLCVRNPWWVVPTVRATRECVAECNRQYGTAHHKNTPANAFRHALWNFYVARACYGGKSKMDKVLEWTERFTNWHEDFSKNPPLARQMDLHNNRVGRLLFEKQPHLQAEEITDIFRSKALASVKVAEVHEIASTDPTIFVHIKD